VNPVMPEVVTQVAAQVIGTVQRVADRAVMQGEAHLKADSTFHPSDGAQPASLDPPHGRRSLLLAEKCGRRVIGPAASSP